MCKFCRGEQLIELKNKLMDKDVEIYISDECLLNIRISATHINSLIGLTSPIRIEFCPFCGFKLNEGA